MRQGWIELVAQLPERLESTVLGVLGPSCLGTQYRPSSEDVGRLVAYYPEARAARDDCTSIVAVLRAEGVAGAAGRVRLRRVPDGMWAERYQEGLQPFAIGSRFLIDPAGCGAHRPGRRTVTLVPGAAFGTGEHATTRLCVHALERHVKPATRWLDVGCGSGILAVVARMCGAGEVHGVDVDPEAVRVAREVVRSNGEAGAIQVARGTHDLAEVDAWDGVVANIQASFFLEFAPSLHARLKPAGLLIASGFLESELDEVHAALTESGLGEVERDATRSWCVLVLRRKDAKTQEVRR